MARLLPNLTGEGGFIIGPPILMLHISPELRAACSRLVQGCLPVGLAGHAAVSGLDNAGWRCGVGRQRLRRECWVEGRGRQAESGLTGVWPGCSRISPARGALLSAPPS
jgi:hypothetical protein